MPGGGRKNGPLASETTHPHQLTSSALPLLSAAAFGYFLQQGDKESVEQMTTHVASSIAV